MVLAIVVDQTKSDLESRSESGRLKVGKVDGPAESGRVWQKVDGPNVET